MIIDVSGILKEFGGRIELDGETAVPDIDFLGESYSFPAPLKIKGSIVNNGKALELEAECSGSMDTRCARCMRDITVSVDFPVREHLVRSDSEYSGDDEIIVFDGSAVKLDGIIEDCLIMNLGSKYLCRDDCKGLCPKCGQDLNEGDCGCDREYIDPRWQGLADLMKTTDSE